MIILKKFAEEFKKRANSDGLLSSRKTSILMKKFGITHVSPRRYAYSNHLEAVIGKGKKKVGWYRIGELLNTLLELEDKK